MKSYVVGGAVRDRLLGLPVSDRDHVVVGATVDEMIAAGYRPVGRDFPVFLHPETHEEYALARTERKVSRGYAGFTFHADPTVTLEADLARRDLTVNAIAEDESDGRLIDPFDGQRDLALRLFRHVGPTFVEDPVRLLRVARFAARFVDFEIAPETLALMREMTRAGEVDALVPERIWQEVARGLMEARPSRMIEALRSTGALARLFPEIDALFAGDRGARMLRSLDRAADAGSPIEARFAVLLQSIDDAGTRIEALCTRLAVPKAARDLAVLVAREHDGLIAADRSAPAERAAAVVGAMERSDAFRRPERFRLAVDAIGLTIDDPDARSRLVGALTQAVDAAVAVDAGAIAREAGYEPARIAERLGAARRAAIVGADGP